MARKLQLHRIINRMRGLLHRNAEYEERFHKALESAIHPGDVVWDVGANEGLFTEIFCRWVGPKGHVVAFEPNPEPLAEARRRIGDCSWLSLENVALGDRDEMSTLIVQENHSRSGHIYSDVEADLAPQSGIPIRINTGDTVCRRTGCVPNVIKIDVEGFEEEVLKGLNESLSSPSLRAVLIEVHFAQLQSRGKATAPVRMEKLLKNSGFKITWVDGNHVKAYRN